MKTRRFATFAIASMLAFAAGIAQATTIGFVGAGPNNANIDLDYGSNIAGDGVGWTTSDGTGATPNVTLYWGGPFASTGWDWEAHNAATFGFIESLNAGGAWDAENPPGTNAVAQLQSQSAGLPNAVNFSVPAGVKFRLNSFDIGNAYDQVAADGTYGFDIALVRDSDSTTVWSHTTPLWGLEDAGPPRVAREESVAVNYTGDLGESYTLTFTRIADADPGNNQVYRSGLDNLSFSQVPEPTSMTLAALCGLGVLMASKRR